MDGSFNEDYRYPIFVIAFLLRCFFLQSLVAATEQVDIYIRDDVYEDYIKFVDGRDVLSINEFNRPFLRRDVTDMVVLQQALMFGAFVKTTIIFQTRSIFEIPKCRKLVSCC